MKNIFLLLIMILSGFYADAKIYYVTPNGTGTGNSWVDAERDLQVAINKASGSGDSVWVKQGLYLPLRDKNGVLNPSNPRTKCFVITSYSNVFGGFLGIPGTEGIFNTRDVWNNPSILSGDLNQNDLNQPDDSFSNDNCYHVVVNDALNSPPGGHNALLDGFTIMKAFNGSGMINLYANIVIRNCLFTKNEAEYGGGIYNQNAKPTIVGCHFRENTGNGGGICSHNGMPKIYRCLFMNNDGLDLGGGILNKSGAISYIENCWFTGNIASLGGAVADNGFDGLTQTNVVHCTISDQYSFNARAFHCSDQSTVKIFNSIVWGNGNTTGNNLFSSVNGGSITISHSDIEGGYLGVGNININPLFVGTPDAHLQTNSPCIDQGDTSGAPNIDFDETIRIVKPDLGCFEKGTFISSVENYDSRMRIGPNPFKTKVFFEVTDVNGANVKVTIFNNEGKLVRDQNVKFESGIGEISDLGLIRGTYIFEIEAGDKKYLRKMTAD